MKIIQFSTKGQELTRDPTDDVLASGTQNYLQCAFQFDKTWSECTKFAAFFEHYLDGVLVPIKDGACLVPDEMAEKNDILISVIGEGPDIRITSTKVTLHQETGGVT